MVLFFVPRRVLGGCRRCCCCCGECSCLTACHRARWRLPPGAGGCHRARWRLPPGAGGCRRARWQPPPGALAATRARWQPPPGARRRRAMQLLKCYCCARPITVVLSCLVLALKTAICHGSPPGSAVSRRRHCSAMRSSGGRRIARLLATDWCFWRSKTKVCKSSCSSNSSRTTASRQRSQTRKSRSSSSRTTASRQRSQTRKSRSSSSRGSANSSEAVSSERPVISLHPHRWLMQ